MSAPKSSRAYGKAWGDTTVPIGNTQGEIDKVIRKYDCFAAIQWTSTLDSLQLRFRSNGRNYLFVMAQFEDDPHENRRTVRAVLWFLKGLFGLDVDAGDVLDPARALLPYLEIAPDVTLSDALEDPDHIQVIQHALGGIQLALEPPR
jgi:hypothetical protein